MRVLFLNRAFGPDSGASGQLLAELCAGLAARHEVTVIAGRGPADGGFGLRPWRRERAGGVLVLRTWGTRLDRRSLLGRLINLGSYALLAFAATFRVGRHDVVVTETDPPLLGVLGARLKRRWGARFVYHCHDVYPDLAEATGELKSTFLRGLLTRGNAYAYRHADRVVVLSEAMRERLVDHRLAPERLVVVPNWIDVRAVVPVDASPLRARFGERFVVMHSGNLGLMQGLDVVIDAARLLRDEPSVVFALVGGGVARDALEQRAHEAGLDNVVFLPAQPKADLAPSLGAADLHLIALRAGLTGCLVPSKVYGVMAAGRPFVAVMDEDAEVAQLAREHRIGFTVRAGDAEGLARAVLEARGRPDELRAMGHRARELAEREYAVEHAVQRFEDVLEGVR